MNRRHFLHAAGAAAATSLGAPAVLKGRFRVFAQSPVAYSGRTIRLMRESPVVDMLCQFAFPDFREEGTPRAQQWLRNPGSFTAADFERMKGSGVKSIALGTGASSYEGGVKLWADWNGFIASRSEWFIRVDDPADVASTRPDGKIGIILSTQGADHFRSAADVETFYQLGQRVAQLTYNFQSRLGAGFLENRDGGLTVFGAEVVAKMEQVGMAVDLSHCADQTTMDAIAIATRPPIFTHATARALLPECSRCKTDEAVKALAARGGVIGVAFIRFMIRPAPAAFAGGWFHSGDLAVLHPDGYMKVKDRSKDIIISGGENISSLEVEDALYHHPAVLAVGVVARPDPKWGETPCAYVELKDGASVTEQELVDHCRARMAGFKIPKTFVFGPLPKTSTGKIQKFVLRDRAKSASAIE